MGAAKEATGKAIEQAKKEEPKTKTKQTTIRFGSLSFTITQDEPSYQPAIGISQEHEGQSNRHLLNKASTSVLNKTSVPVPLPITQKHPSTHKAPTHKPTTKELHTSTCSQTLTTTVNTEPTPFNAQQPKSAPKFVKVSQPTNEWQKAVRKTGRKAKSDRNQQRICFYCHKEGHIQRFCWKRIKCHHCARTGHKSASCYFKPPPSHQHRSLIQQRQKEPTHLKPVKQHPANHLMNFIHGRPPLSDIYRPTRHTLNEENEYLFKVGLIVLIRGFPTPDFPQLVASQLVAEHGGRLTDYNISQATITPYIVTCTNSRTRDTIVRRGLYSIPQTQIQFTVHEWRPRFGMSYDPPSHQLWIKIIGLPLQAWTQSQISAIIQSFGHPLQFLPFGEEVGHYIDITVLVASKHPNRIPLAYMYREGDYSTKVDILIMSCRLWENTDFPPPPDDPMLLQQPSPAHTNRQNSPTVPLNRSSSSSSNDAPSEPTIDYSSWSPRSYRLKDNRTRFWKLKGPNPASPITTHPTLQPQPHLNLTPHFRPPPFTPPQSLQLAMFLSTPPLNHPLFFNLHLARSPTFMTLTSTPPLLMILTSTPSPHRSFASPHISLPSPGILIRGSPFLVAENPTRMHGFRSTYPTPQAYFLATPRIYLLHDTHPILINSPSHLMEKWEARKNLTTPSDHASPFVPPTTSSHLSLSVFYLSPVEIFIRAIIAEYYKLITGPLWPKNCTPTKQHSLSLAQSPTLPHASSLARSNIVPPYCAPPSPQSCITPVSQSPAVLQSPLGDIPLMEPIQNNYARSTHISTYPAIDTHVPMNRPTYPMSLTYPAIDTHMPLTQTMAKQAKRGKEKEKEKEEEKGKHRPLRRSTRLQAKQRYATDSAKRSPGPKTQHARIAFDFNAQESPLDATTTLTILQATGLKIDKGVEDAIEEALKKDMAHNAMDQHIPTTPLHDPIPPLIIPGFNLPL